MRSTRARRWAAPAVSGVLAVALSFLVGIRSANEGELIDFAQAEESVAVVLTLQYIPRDGGDPRPLVFSNVSGTKPVKLQEVHDASVVLPERAADGCQRTNSAGRCTIAGIAVGSGGMVGGVERQYDIFLAPAAFFETLTGIPFETPLPFMRFNPQKCTGNVFTDANPGEGEEGWCLSRKQDGSSYREYVVTLTLSERDVCRDAPPPPPQCTADGKIVEYTCDPAYRGATKPWKPLPPSTCEGDYAECPDGTAVPAFCVDLDGVAACSQVEACKDHQLCEVESFPTPPPVLAGRDEIVITGKNFGNKGGAVSFARSDPEGKGVESEREVVRIPPGPNWSDTRIRVNVPYTAGEGSLKIIPEGYPKQKVDIRRNQPTRVGEQSAAATILGIPKAFAQFGFPGSGLFGAGQASVSVSKDEGKYCESPTLYVVSAEAYPYIVSASISAPGDAPVTPGAATTVTVLAGHPQGVDHLYALDIELLEGSFSRPADIPLNRSPIASSQCNLREQLPGVKTVRETSFQCSVRTPATLTAKGPFTYYVRISGGQEITVKDSGGPSPGDDPRTTYGLSAVIPVSGGAALAGDFNADGMITVVDAAIASRIVRGVLAATSEHKLHDTDGDRTITRSDLLNILHFLARE